MLALQPPPRKHGYNDQLQTLSVTSGENVVSKVLATKQEGLQPDHQQQLW